MPQLENGYIRIATELVDALVGFRIPGEQMQCFMFIIRKTYGFHKKTDSIALSQFVNATGIRKQHICRALNLLADKNMIIITKYGNRLVSSYSINKNYNSWKALPKKVTLPKMVKGSPQKGNRVVPKKGHTKDIITKDTITKDIYIRISEFEAEAKEKLSPITDPGLFKTFTDYWTEIKKSGKKFRYEDQKYFDFKKRFATFQKNNRNTYDNKLTKVYKEEGYVSKF